MKIAIVGVSGAVGQELLALLDERNFPVDQLLLFGSARSAGNTYTFRGEEILVKELREGDDFRGVDVAFVSAGGQTSQRYAETITKHGAVMIDNSSAFRMDPEVPLVVPEVNAHDALIRPKGIIANPNCSTIQMVVLLDAINKLSPVRRVRVSTYQAASGAGAAAMQELEDQNRAVCEGKEPRVEKFAHRIAGNLIPQVDVFLEDGYTKEEMKMQNETRKILHSDVLVSATCVRVPVARAHSESVWVETAEPLDLPEIRNAFGSAPGVVVDDDPAGQSYPMPYFAAGKDPVYVGRIRRDLCDERGITFWCVSDQIRKGAALNAIQIVEFLLTNSDLGA